MVGNHGRWERKSPVKHLPPHCSLRLSPSKYHTWALDHRVPKIRNDYSVRNEPQSGLRFRFRFCSSNDREQSGTQVSQAGRKQDPLHVVIYQYPLGLFGSDHCLLFFSFFHHHTREQAGETSWKEVRNDVWPCFHTTLSLSLPHERVMACHGILVVP